MSNSQEATIAELYERMAEIAVEHGRLLGLKPAFVRLLLRDNPEPDDLDTFLRAGAGEYGVPITPPEMGDGVFAPDTPDELFRLMDGGRG